MTIIGRIMTKLIAAARTSTREGEEKWRAREGKVIKQWEWETNMLSYYENSISKAGNCANSGGPKLSPCREKQEGE